MRSITIALACLLSLLIGVTSASNSMCGLSCWLAQASSGCESAMSQTDMEMAGMDMGAGMKMGSVGKATPGTDRHGKFHHSMTAEMGMPGGLFANTVAQQSRSNATPNPMHPSTCAQDSCRQGFAASSPPRTVPALLPFVATHVLVSTHVRMDSQIISGTPPPPALACECAAVPLRI